MLYFALLSLGEWLFFALSTSFHGHSMHLATVYRFASATNPCLAHGNLDYIMP